MRSRLMFVQSLLPFNPKMASGINNDFLKHFFTSPLSRLKHNKINILLSRSHAEQCIAIQFESVVNVSHSCVHLNQHFLFLSTDFSISTFCSPRGAHKNSDAESKREISYCESFNGTTVGAK